MSSLDTPTFLIATLGCKVNQYESQLMREQLLRNGFVETTSQRDADFYIVNSCTVTQKADKETRNLIRRLNRINPIGKIVVTGCYAETESDRRILMDIPGVAVLVRNREKHRIAEIVSRLSERRHTTITSFYSANITNFDNHNRAFVKVQDGCDHRCSYCKVRLARGPSKSRDIEEIIKEVTLLVSKGFKEIVLTGICLGAWGRDLEGGKGFEELVREVCCLDGIFRIRLSSIEPIYITDELLGIMKKNHRLCNHLHIPLQSGDDKVLKLMARPYTTRKFWQIIDKARKFIPDIAITTDVLVGFPGEDERSFQNTLEFVKEIKPSRMHVFSYSRREGTIASCLKSSITSDIVRERVSILTTLSQAFSMEFAKQFVGKIQEAVIEDYREKTRGLLRGYTDRYVRIFAEGADSARNRLVAVKLTHVDENQNLVFGRILEG